MTYAAQAQPTFVGNASNSAIDGGDVTLDLSGLSMVEDDLVVVCSSQADVDTAADLDITMMTSGYTEIADLYVDETGRDTNLAAFYKLMGASPDSNAIINGSAKGNSGHAAVAQVFRNVDTMTPLDVASTTVAQTDTAIPDPPSIDHNAGDVWVAFCAGNAYNGSASTTFTNPTGYTTNAVQAEGLDTADATVGMGYNASPSDPEDPGALTWSGTDGTAFSSAAITLALRPEAASGALLLRRRR